MSKLRLDLESLVVESFETGEEERTRGTVHGHASARCDTENITCGAETCDWANYTCQRSCGQCGTYYCPPVDETGMLGCISAIGICESGVCTGLE